MNRINFRSLALILVYSTSWLFLPMQNLLISHLFKSHLVLQPWIIWVSLFSSYLYPRLWSHIVLILKSIVLFRKYFHYGCLFPVAKLYLVMVRTLFSEFLYSSLSTSAVLDTKKDAIYLVNSQKRNNVCTRSAVENLIKCDIKPFVSMFPTWEFPY